MRPEEPVTRRVLGISHYPTDGSGAVPSGRQPFHLSGNSVHSHGCYGKIRTPPSGTNARNIGVCSGLRPLPVSIIVVECPSLRPCPCSPSSSLPATKRSRCPP